MATFKYLSDLVQSRDDESITEPRVLYEFPNLNCSIEFPANNPAVPAGRALVTVTGIDGNMDRAIDALMNVSKFI